VATTRISLPRGLRDQALLIASPRLSPWAEWHRSSWAATTCKTEDLAGQRVYQLMNGVQERGTYEIRWNGRDRQGRNAASGIYLCRLLGEEGMELTRKMLLLR